MVTDRSESRSVLERLRRFRYRLARRLFQLRLTLARRPTLAARLLSRRVRRSAEPPFELELITIAFNNEQVIRLQCETLRRHILDRYHWTVADNSPSRRCRRALRSFCRENGIAYLPLPRNPYTGRD